MTVVSENKLGDVLNEMPPALRWIEDVAISATADLNPQALHIVATEKSDTEQATPTLLAAMLPTAVSESIHTDLQACGWNGNGTYLHRASGQSFLLVAASTHKNVSATRKARQIGIDAASVLAQFKYQQVVICGGKYEALDMFDGLVMGLYRLKFKDNAAHKDDKEAELPQAVELLAKCDTADIAKRRSLARAVMFTRALQDSPPNWMHSEKLAEVVAKACEGLPIKFKAFGREQMREMGMGSFLAVAAGSSKDPKMLVLEVEGHDSSRNIALVGKGVTFDTGGISLKPPAAMMDMKYDMSGAAAVIGTMLHLAHAKPAVNVIGLIGAVENMPSSMAVRPSDIVTAMNGMSIEILNTDAEGRLVLADLLCYACKHYEPRLIVDIATLTGAVLMAVGSCGAALMTNKQQAADYVRNNADIAGEPIWQLPMWDEFRKEVKGSYSDLKNITSPGVRAGTITAACFLEKFVGDTPWVHLDIAGTAYDSKATGYPNKGSTAFGLRTMESVCQNFSEDMQ
ncbi:MAG: M17 family metallopeptidase [Pseudomonadota bacterium]|nr:M17 family metallopeptidase [Pseudomonadota bacterium]